MSNQLYTYSIVRALYDKGDDYIDSFWPFVLAVLPRDQSFLAISVIQREVAGKYSLSIPHHSLSVILNRAERKSLIFKKDGFNEYSLTQEGFTCLNEYELESEVKRRIAALVEDAKNFLNEEWEESPSLDNVKDMIQAFAVENVEFLEQLTNVEKDEFERKVEKKLSRRHERALLKYFMRVEKAQPDIFKTLQDIFCGSIISTVVHNRSFPESVKKFERTVVYFDTNFVFSLLGMNYEEFNKPAQELFSLMKAEGVFEFKVFDFTIDEMSRVLREYGSEQERYAYNIKIGTIYSSLKSKGWTVGDVKEFLATVEEKLWEIGTRVQPTKIDISVYRPISEDYLTDLLACKPMQDKLGQNHDLAAIELIAKFRGSPVRRLEKAKVFFLTSDKRLAKYNFEKRGHKVHATVCEVIPDRMLTNMLWLKKPTLLKEIPMDVIVSMHSRHLFIDKVVWKFFHEKVRELRDSEDIDDRDITLLLYDTHFQEALGDLGPNDVAMVKSDLILQNIESARKSLDASFVRKMEDQKQFFEDRQKRSEREKEDKIYRTLTEAKKSIKNEAERDAKRITVEIVLLGCLVFFYPLKMLIAWVVKEWQYVQPAVWTISTIIMVLTFFFGSFFSGSRIKNDKNRLFSYLFNLIYLKKLKSSRIKDFESILLDVDET